jgi:hypothetical protein
VLHRAWQHFEDQLLGSLLLIRAQKPVNKKDEELPRPNLDGQLFVFWYA